MKKIITVLTLLCAMLSQGQAIGPASNYYWNGTPPLFSTSTYSMVYDPATKKTGYRPFSGYDNVILKTGAGNQFVEGGLFLYDTDPNFITKFASNRVTISNTLNGSSTLAPAYLEFKDLVNGGSVRLQAYGNPMIADNNISLPDNVTGIIALQSYVTNAVSTKADLTGGNVFVGSQNFTGNVNTNGLFSLKNPSYLTDQWSAEVKTDGTYNLTDYYQTSVPALTVDHLGSISNSLFAVSDLGANRADFKSKGDAVTLSTSDGVGLRMVKSGDWYFQVGNPGGNATFSTTTGVPFGVATFSADKAIFSAKLGVGRSPDYAIDTTGSIRADGILIVGASGTFGGDVEVSASNGIIETDTVTGTRYKIQITSGVITLTPLP